MDMSKTRIKANSPPKCLRRKPTLIMRGPKDKMKLKEGSSVNLGIDSRTLSFWRYLRDLT